MRQRRLHVQREFEVMQLENRRDKLAKEVLLLSSRNVTMKTIGRIEDEGKMIDLNQSFITRGTICYGDEELRKTNDGTIGYCAGVETSEVVADHYDGIF